ncbi:MAG TPA: hypothetical protein ENJ87_02120, partial [Gammaproteobacteria bacterium]|nr:hypothetical protein [Gammaproteobacteria bacterium]
NITSTGLRKKREGERLRIGYISADFCMHPVGFFIEPLLACHDKAKVEVFCYANMRESQADEITHRLCAVSDHWRFIGERNDVELVKIIQQDEIDVLVDLAGHTRGNRLKVFTYRPAPVQAMYLGYCASSGLQAMDYWITDDILHPPDTPELSTEQIVRLPRCSFCYQPPLNVAIKDSLGRDTDTVVFASYSNLSKLLPDVIATWSKILTAVGGSRLMIMDKYMADEATRKVLLDQFRDNGISADRLMIKGNLPYADYYSSYSDVDIVLDPFPRTGGTTTADALWMGVPVITLAGQRYVERISAAKLCTLGLEELVADNEDQYISIAVKLSDDEDYRMRLRKSLRDRMRESQLCDGKGLAEAMEAAYRKMVDCL